MRVANEWVTLPPKCGMKRGGLVIRRGIRAAPVSSFRTPPLHSAPQWPSRVDDDTARPPHLPHDGSRRRIAAPKIKRRGYPEPEWVDYTDEQLLELRMCDLGLRIEGTELEWLIARLYDELARKGLSFRPYFWLSNEWFTPDAHSRHRDPVLPRPPAPQGARAQADATRSKAARRAWCMRILRHEVGHAIDNAYRLHFRTALPRAVRELVRRPTRTSTSPSPTAELRRPPRHVVRPGPPGRRLRRDLRRLAATRLELAAALRGWPARAKARIRRRADGARSPAKPRPSPRGVQSKPLRELKQTLGEHYREKRHALHAGDLPDFYDNDLRRLFSDDPKYRKNPTAAQLPSRDQARACGGWCRAGRASTSTRSSRSSTTLSPVAGSCACAWSAHQTHQNRQLRDGHGADDELPA